ncbi:PREDICTED: small integral membrane protein 20-like [Galeopterus variegatus]|uniref:Small integral membrane protein 20-like n=2 Tax=Boreoeutheria TaxID=1437010 RepID=A0ABM0RQM5_GALVR|nr:PREDICTED: small integral membrane protein 20-like [Galeopterus variegatus]
MPRSPGNIHTGLRKPIIGAWLAILSTLLVEKGRYHEKHFRSGIISTKPSANACITGSLFAVQSSVITLTSSRKCLRPGSESRSASSERGHGPAVGSKVSESAGRFVGQGGPRPGAMSRNLRTALIFGGFISLIGAAFYPIYFRPLMRLEEYQKEQAINRAGIVQEDVQPPGLKVWSDPFGRK